MSGDVTDGPPTYIGRRTPYGRKGRSNASRCRGRPGAARRVVASVG